MTNIEMMPPKTLLYAVMLIALSPVIFAATTATFTNDIPIIHRFMLVFSIPVALLELCVLAFAFSENISLFAIVKRWPIWARLVFLVLAMVAILTAGTATADPVSALVRTSIWLLHLGFGLALFGLTEQALRNTAISTLWAWMLGGVIAYAAGLAIFVALIPNPQTFEWMLFNFGVTNVRQLSFYATVGCAIAYGLFLTTKHAQRMVSALLIAVVPMTIILWSGTRSGIIALFFGLLILQLTLRSTRSVSSFAFLPLAFVLAVPLSLIYRAPSPAMGFERMWSDSARDGLDAKTSGRLELWKGALEKIPEKLFFGYGESQFRLVVKANQGTYNHPHNSIIQIIFQWGLVGASCFFALFGFAWFQLWRVAKQLPEAGVPAYMVVSSLFGFSLVEGSLYHTWPVMIMAGVTAIALGARSAALKPAAPVGSTHANAASLDHPK